MKKALKILLSVIVTVYFAGSMFYCLVAGAPLERERALPYIISAGVFSVLLCTFVCVCLHYIGYLQKKLEEHKQSE